MAREKTRIYQFTLTEESIQILEMFASKYGTLKSVVVNRALQLLGAKYHSKIVISYDILSEKDSTTTTTEPKSIYQNTIEDHVKKYGTVDDNEEMSDEEINEVINSIQAKKKARIG